MLLGRSNSGPGGTYSPLVHVQYSPKRSYTEPVQPAPSSASVSTSETTRSTRSRARFLGICVCYLGFGSLFNTSAYMMGQLMPESPLFLLWSTTVLYTGIFFGMATCSRFVTRKRQFMLRADGRFEYAPISLLPPWYQHRQILVLAVLTFANGIAFQYADPFVDGATQQLLLALAPPMAGLVSRYALGRTFHRGRWLGAAITVAGVSLGVVLPQLGVAPRNADSASHVEGWGSPWWAAIFLASVLLSALEVVWQEKAFRRPYFLDPTICLAWYNLWSLLGYLVWMLGASMVEGVVASGGNASGGNGGGSDSSPFARFWNQEWLALRCVLLSPSNHHLPDTFCARSGPSGRGPTLWVLLFSVSYAGYFYMQALLIDCAGAFFAEVLSVALAPLSTLLLAWPLLVGKHALPPTWALWASLAITTVGLMVYQFSYRELSRKEEEAEALLSVPAEHEVVGGSDVQEGAVVWPTSPVT